MYLSQQSSRGRWPLGYQEEGLGRGSDGNLYFTESKLTFETGGAGGAFHSYDLGMRQAALPDGSLDEMSSALIKDGRMVRSATFQRLETGGYRITGVAEGQPIEETVEDLALTTHGAMRLWVKDQPVGATQSFLLPVAQRPWKLEAQITVTKVAEDGSRTVELDEQWRGNRRRTRSIIGPGGLSRGLHWQLDEDTALVGTLAR